MADERWLLYKQVQYDFMMKNLGVGEFVEIYEEMANHVNYNFGPPESEVTLTLDEFLSLPPTGIINKHKMIIHRK